MKLFTLFADLTLSTANFGAEIETAKAKGKSLAQALGADSDSIKKSFEDAFTFAAGDLLADAVREGLQAVGQFALESIGVASDLQETNSKIDAIFGDMASNVHNWAKTTKDQFGIGEAAAKGYAGQLASLLSADSLNLTTDQIYEMSTGLVELAGDLASFHNMSFDTVWMKLLSGMRGETEAIEDLGIDVRASAMAAYLEISTNDWGYLDQKTRTLATYKYILENTTVAQGDFVRTQDQYANQMRIFNENITQLKVSFGESLLPVMNSLVTWFNALFASEEDAANGITSVRDSYEASYISIETTTANALALVNALSELEAAGEDTADNDTWNAILGELKTVLPQIGELIEEENGRITGGTIALREYVNEWSETAKQLARFRAAQDMFDAYGETSAQIAKLQVQQEIADIRETGALDKMEQLRESFWDDLTAAMRAEGATVYEIQTAERFFGPNTESGFWDQITQKNVSIEDVLWSQYIDSLGRFGVSLDDMKRMEAVYEEQRSLYDEYSKVDNSEEIAQLQELLAKQDEELEILRAILAKDSNVNVDVTAQIDGEQIETRVVRRITLDVANKGLTGRALIAR